MEPDPTPNAAPDTTQEAVTDATTPTPALDAAALAKELEAARRDAAKYRTRAKQYEEAEKAAREEALKAKPLEERLAAVERERDELKTARETAERERALAEVRADIAAAGVPKELQRDALRLYLAEVEDAEDDDSVPTFDAFLEARPYLKGAAKPAPTLPGVPSGGGKPAGEAAQLEAQLAEARKGTNRALVIGLETRLHELRARGR